MSPRLHSPAIGLGWHLWRRNKIGISVLTSYLVLLVLLAHAPASRLATTVVYVLCMPFGIGILYLMGIFTHGEADVVASGSGYPSYLLTLPIRTRSLVIWPMLYGTVLVSFAWIALAEWVIRPRGGSVAVAWPAAMLATITASLQAIFWSPIRMRYLRLVLILLVIPATIALSMLGVQCRLAPAGMAGMFLVLLPFAFTAAWYGLVRARRGDSAESTWLSGVFVRSGADASLRTSRRPNTRFATSTHAQLWLEWGRNGLMLPLLVGGACILFSLPLFWVRDFARLNDAPTTGWQSAIEINIYIKTYLLNLWLLPPFIAAISGYGPRKSKIRRDDDILPVFLATRPLTDLDFVLAKWRVAAYSTLTAWAILLAFAAGWHLAPVRTGSASVPFLIILLTHLTWQSTLTTLLALACLIGWTWRNQVLGLFASLSNRPWLGYGYTFLGIVMVQIALVVGVTWTANPDRMPAPRTLEILFACALGIGLALKAIVTAVVFHGLRRRRLVASAGLARGTMCWSLTVCGFWASLHWFLRPGIFPISASLPPLFRSDTCLLAFAILCVPIARMAAAPLELSLSRHR